MSSVVGFAKDALDAILNNKARVAMAVVVLAAVAGVNLTSAQADVLVTLLAFAVWVLEEAARMARKAQAPGTVTVTGPVPVAPAAPETPPAPVP